MHDTDRALNALKELGERILQPIIDENFPVLEIPDRKTDNIVFDKTLNQFVLGPSSVIRDSSNVKHVRSFAQLTWTAAFAKELIEAARTSSLRDLYYSSEAFGVKFRNQSESDRIVTDLECITGLPREGFGIYPEEHSSIYGKVRMKYTVPGYEGREIDLTISPDGLPIGPALMTAEPIDSDAQIVLAVESTRSWSDARPIGRVSSRAALVTSSILNVSVLFSGFNFSATSW